MAGRSIPQVLEEIATLLDIKGDNPFKTRAYYNAAKILSGIEDLEELVRAKRLKEIRGIGDAIAAKIDEYINTGTIAYYDELKKEVPPTLLELLQVPGLGPKKIKILYDRLNVANVGELEYACKENRLINLPGFGKKTQEKILKGIEFIKQHKGEFLFGDVYLEAERIKERLQQAVAEGLVEVCGSIRRRKEVVKDIDILVGSREAEKVSSVFSSLPAVAEVLLAGDTKTSCRLRSGIEADLRVVGEEAFPYALMYFTGSKEHNVRLRGIAKRQGLKLNEYGLFKDERLLRCRSEEEIYNALGLAFIPPELREDLGEVEASEEGTLPKLVGMGDILGAFHVHTEFSDGVDSVAKTADGARRMGYSYIGISDHSKSAYYASGLSAEELRRQWDIIDSYNREHPDFCIFKGIESDILPDGSLDYPDDILEKFDFVIASVHSNFTMKKDDQMRRIMRAMKNPYTTMLGHPTGRLLLSREGYEVDMKSIIDAAAEHGVIIELNSSPYRLDIDWRHLRYAKEKGVMISINPDAHSTGGLTEVVYGVGIARKGWQEKKDILNTRTAAEVAKIFKKRINPNQGRW
ncbi:MAG TPA: DNA polymerase/3'-5' exonuclease PolX [Syntrophorhabdaceae bacterium]|nr:DNA polymerase/3'-5' exonuclease PolX [Syntrophorhabdaceae bacterium]HQM80246.1 DNA polymerase/3'-5' exonuclease PolX [Syntrophorhabdaceae bacterium]